MRKLTGSQGSKKTPLALYVYLWKEMKVIDKPLSQGLSCEKGSFGAK